MSGEGIFISIQSYLFKKKNITVCIRHTSKIPCLEVSRPTKYSVMARLIGKQSGKTIAVRADMDALPIHEENEFDFISAYPV